MDQILICTDGLTDTINDEGIAHLLNSHPTHPAFALVAEATAAGARDNVTAIVIGPSLVK